MFWIDKYTNEKLKYIFINQCAKDYIWVESKLCMNNENEEEKLKKETLDTHEAGLIFMWNPTTQPRADE